MLKLQILCVGKLKESFYLQAVQEYAKRLTPFCKLQIKELPEERLPDAPSPAQLQAALEKEAHRLLPELEKSTVIALCIEGKLLSSEQLSETLSRMALDGQSSITFVIGGSCGLAPAIKQRANIQLSMSPMTFPHHMARVMLLEQIYRAFQIAQGGKYHK